jgi:hypothetical protein
MTALLMRSEETGAVWQVWPEPEGVELGTAQETGSYLFELHGSTEADGADLLIDDLPLEALRAVAPNSARWRWSPGFHAGTVEAELRIPGKAPRRFEIVTDPDLRKLTREDFDAMVREILDDTFALFSLSSFRKTIGRGSGTRPPAIARLEFLRSRVEELEAIVAAILRNPRRVLTATEISVPYHRAKRATGPEILRSFRSGRVQRETVVPSRLPAPLRGYLPQSIRVRRRDSSLDLPEHRQMAACLRSWAAWLAAVAELLGGARSDSERRQTAASWAARCRRLSRRIIHLASAAPFAEAGEAPPRLTHSALFRNDPAYRRFYRIWQDMNLGIAAVFGDFLDLPLARTFELYELWCFLRLVRAGAEAFGPAGLVVTDLFRTDAAGGVTICKEAVTVPVGGGWKLCFQKQYREFWKEPDRRGSYSRTMVPDIVIVSDGGGEAEKPSRLIVIDAKYRIDEGLPDALNSIHTYRDALIREGTGGKTESFVNAAYLVAPQMPATVGDYREAPMPNRLFHPEYRRSYQFGAVTLRPGMSVANIATALKGIISDATGG